MRVFYITCICLILPLVIYSLLITRIDYEKRAQGIYQAVTSVTEEKIHLFLQVIDVQFAAMKSLGELISTVQLDDENIQKILNDFAAEDFIYSVYLIRSTDPDGHFSISHASDPTLVGQDMSAFIKRHDLSRHKESFFIGSNLNEQSVLFLSQPLKDDNQAILMFEVRFEKLISSIFSLSEWSEMDVSLISSNGYIAASSRVNIQGLPIVIESFDYPHQNTIVLKPIRIADNEAYSFQWNQFTFFAVLKPIPKSDLKLMTAIPKQVLYSPIQKLVWEIVIVLGLILMIGGLGLFLLLRKFSEPIHQLQQCFSHVAQGDLDYQYRKMKLGFEINMIGDAFNQTILRLKSVMKEVEIAKIQENVLAKELELGQQVQHSLLPTQFERSQSLEIAGKFISAKQVGGDCYDFIAQDDRCRDLIFIADTAGKGVMACLYALNLRSLIRAYSDSRASLQEIVLNTNRMFYKDTEENGVFVTSWLAIFDREQGLLHYTSAGHPPAILKRASGEIELLSTKGIAFGAIEANEIEIKEIYLNSGDLLILYTDGVIESRNKNEKLYGIEQLVSTVQQISLIQPKDIAEQIYQSCIAFSEGEEQADDIALLVIKCM
ncbi:MAG: PP2C family protein-serine/threonine phosphatase [Simkaniaceae bacterium]|nr:PP2C family protein-serine/threonine phosphatase [Simkaniaceae bacterium]